jgi:hypothetical protein
LYFFGVHPEAPAGNSPSKKLSGRPTRSPLLAP